ncbi:solute carrier family 28 member 3-like [Ornithodoros turicata]|uniref:solute carrier family 28 member 3-like n=1 Tax=Ornithodoros turicata TaxID=34597 RepID=UPI0031392428
MSPIKTKRTSEESLNSASSHEEETQSVMSFILSKGQSGEPSIIVPPPPPELPVETRKRRCTCDCFRKCLRICAKLLGCILLHAFFIWATVRHRGISTNGSLCNPLVFLAVAMIFLDVRLLCIVATRCGARKPFASAGSYVVRKFQQATAFKLFTRIAWTLVYGAITIFLVVDSWGHWPRLISAFGLAVMLFFGYIFSKNRSQIRWNLVLSGVLLQIMMGVLMLRIKYGKLFIECLANIITTIMTFSDAGSRFVFGYLATGSLHGGVPHQPPIFAFTAIPSIFFFGMLVSVLYFYNILQYVVLRFSWLMNTFVGTSGIESFCAAANVFVGMNEAPVLVKPYLPTLTKSEIHCIMTAGMATIAGSLFAVYVSVGVKAEYILAASVMSAPAALAFSKLFYPESADTLLGQRTITLVQSTESNVLEAMANGVTSMIGIAAAIITCLISFVALVALGDSVFVLIGELIGWKFLTLNWVMGRLFLPLALLMGVNVNECSRVASLVGIKTVLNEFIAYRYMASDLNAGLLSVRAELICTYALCGFSNLGSIGVQLGAFSAMMPTRLKDCSEVATRAFISGSMACFMTACVAGALSDTSQYDHPVKFPSIDYI